MVNSKRLRGWLGLAVISLLALGLSSCGTSRKMGCPMQFGQVTPDIQWPAPDNSLVNVPNQFIFNNPASLCIES